MQDFAKYWLQLFFNQPYAIKKLDIECHGLKIDRNHDELSNLYHSVEQFTVD